jgi:hypothetical protein
MNRQRCEYLGLKDDPSTALDFPSGEGNHCHRTRKVSAIHPQHQEKYCLVGEHVNCPIYLAANARKLPAAMASTSANSRRARPVLALILLPLLLVSAMVLGYALQSLGIIHIGGPDGLIANTGGGMETPTWGFFDLPRQAETSYSQLFIPVLGSQGQGDDCDPPSGWEAYNVQPTDSLFRLSTLHGISVEELAIVNCLGDKMLIQAGQMLFVPSRVVLGEVAPTPITQRFVVTPLPGANQPVVSQPVQQGNPTGPTGTTVETPVQATATNSPPPTTTPTPRTEPTRQNPDPRPTNQPNNDNPRQNPTDSPRNDNPKPKPTDPPRKDDPKPKPADPPRNDDPKPKPADPPKNNDRGKDNDREKNNDNDKGKGKSDDKGNGTDKGNSQGGNDKGKNESPGKGKSDDKKDEGKNNGNGDRGNSGGNRGDDRGDDKGKGKDNDKGNDKGKDDDKGRGNNKGRGN